MRKLILFFLIIFLFNKIHVTPSYAALPNPITNTSVCTATAPCAQECAVNTDGTSTATCLGGWGNWVRITLNRELTSQDVEEIMIILLQVYPDFTTSIAGGLAASEYSKILESHVGDPWNKELQDTILKETNDRAAAIGGGGAGVNTSGTNWGQWGNLDSATPLNTIKNFITGNQPGNAPQSELKTIIGLIINLLIFLAIILSLFFLVWGGFDWIMSGGDKQKLAQAREKLTFAIIGLIVVFVAFLIIYVIGNIFRIDPLSFIK